jgi:hypothetical protein
MASRHSDSSDIEALVSNGITGKQKRIIKDELNKSYSDNNGPEQGRTKISFSVCQRIKHKVENEGVKWKDIAEELDVSKSVIWYHINDNCVHDDDECVDNYRGVPSQRKCGFIRSLAEMGKSPEEIAEILKNARESKENIIEMVNKDYRGVPNSDEDIYVLNINQKNVEEISNTVLRWIKIHLKGECQHKNYIQPFSEREIEKNKSTDDGVRKERIGEKEMVFENI